MSIKETIFKEARFVRDWALSKGAPKDLFCWCAICSYEIFKRLERFNPVFYLISISKPFLPREGHCYIRCAGYLIDVTARQFNKRNEPIVVSRKPPSNAWYWSEKNCSAIDREYLSIKRAYSVEEIQDLLRTWPSDQRPDW